MQLKIHTAALLLPAFLAAGCNAQSKAKTKLEPVEIIVVTTLEPAFQENLWSYPQGSRKKLLKAFDEIAVDGKVTMSEMKRRTTVYDSGLRGRLIGGILTLDLDGDMELSRDEVARLDDPDYTGWMSEYVRTRIPFSEMDTDEDGTVTMNELQLFARIYARDQVVFFERESLLHLMVFDEDGDGILTKDELTTSFDRQYDYISKMKREAAPVPSPLPKSDQDRQDAQDEKCTPDILPGPDDEIVMLSGRGGTALSSVAVANQSKVTMVTRVKIEPGDRKLYVMAAPFNNMIWSVEGDTSRVAGFVTATGKEMDFAGVGVVGLGRKDVAFLPDECLGFYKGVRSEQAIISKTRYERIFDHDIDKVIAEYPLNTINLPSGIMLDHRIVRDRARQMEKQGGGSELAENGILFSIFGRLKDPKGNSYFFGRQEVGLATVPRDKVISPVAVEDYDVYPGDAGMRQLILEGKIEPVESYTFYIKETFPRFPAGIRVKFILGEGVALPRGTVGNSSVRSEETGKCLIGICY